MDLLTPSRTQNFNYIQNGHDSVSKFMKDHPRLNKSIGLLHSHSVNRPELIELDPNQIENFESAQ